MMWSEIMCQLMPSSTRPQIWWCYAPAGIKFNVVMFGSSHKFMHRACVAVSEATAAAAEVWVQANVNANWGGTEILSVLEAIYKVPAAEGAPPDPVGPACFYRAPG